MGGNIVLGYTHCEVHSLYFYYFPGSIKESVLLIDEWKRGVFALLATLMLFRIGPKGQDLLTSRKKGRTYI